MKERLGWRGWRGDRGRDVDVIDQRDRGRGRGSRSAERAVASRGDGVEEQRGRLGGGVANIGLHVQQGRDVNFHGEARQVPIPTAGEQGSRRAETSQRDLQPIPLNSSPLSSQRVPRPLLTPGTSPALSLPLCQTPGAIPTHSAPDT